MRATQDNERDDPVCRAMYIKRGGSDVEGIGMATPRADRQLLIQTPTLVGELDGRQVAVISLETQQCVDGREAAWRVRCRKNGMDVDPMVDKVWEYLLEKWVDIEEYQKWRVSAKKVSSVAPSCSCCALGIDC